MPLIRDVMFYVAVTYTAVFGALLTLFYSGENGIVPEPLSIKVYITFLVLAFVLASLFALQSYLFSRLAYKEKHAPTRFLIKFIAYSGVLTGVTFFVAIIALFEDVSPESLYVTDFLEHVSTMVSWWFFASLVLFSSIYILRSISDRRISIALSLLLILATWAGQNASSDIVYVCYILFPVLVMAYLFRNWHPVKESDSQPLY